MVILAAGKGTRMFSKKPKVLHTIAGTPLIGHVLESALTLAAQKTHIVVGYGSDQIYTYFKENRPEQNVIWSVQDKQLGTGHALQQACPNIDHDATNNQVLILYGDVPLIRPETLASLLSDADDKKVSLLTLITTKNRGLGRILRNDSDEVIAIVEEKDATDAQKKITEVNSGIMAVPASLLEPFLRRIENKNKQSEYYLTDIIELAVTDGYKINALTIDDEMEVQGINDKTQLALVERHYQMEIVDRLAEEGVTLRDPRRVDVRGELICGEDVVIDVNVLFEGSVTLGNNVIIGPNVSIKDSTIGPDTKILSGTIIENSKVGSETIIGPYARLRPGTVLKNKVKVGNFVETKKVVIGEGSKASHLAYIGDAEIGENCNIGAGTIFCNYDGANKHKTILGDNVFIGSNSTLVAPVTLLDNAFVAAGSTVTVEVPEGSLAVSRGKQRNISGWKRPTKPSGG